MIITISIFVLILTVLILVHEFGHFITAKRSGAKVEEFGIGFPPRLFGVRKGETIYTINLLPIGGFVKIHGEDGADQKDPRSFASKSLATRSFIIVAGVAMNILFAAVLLSVGHFIGLPKLIDETSLDPNMTDISVRIAAIAEQSPASEADLRAGDVMYMMEAEGSVLSQIDTITSVQDFTDQHLGSVVTLSVMRGNTALTMRVVPRENPPEGEGAIGIAMMRTGTISYPAYLAPLKGIESTIALTIGTLRAFGGIIVDLVRSGAVQEELAGPIGIAVITGQVQQLGFIFLLQFMALISVNLAIINVLPFPALDGGRLLFLAIEKLKGSPVNQKYEKFAHTVGFALLIVVMILVTFRDISRFL